MFRVVGLFGLALLVLSPLSGCQAISTEVEYRNMIVQTKMNQSLFLSPVANQDRLIYVQVTNTSNEQTIDLKSALVQDLQQNGWTVTDDLSKAQQMLQVNILQAGVTTPEAMNNLLQEGFGAGMVGGGLVAATGGSMPDAAVAGVAVGLSATVADAMVQDITVSLTTDVQILLRLPPNEKVPVNATPKPGDPTVTTDYVTGTSWLQYQRRVISSANQANLKFKDAQPQMTSELAGSIAGIF